MSRKNNTNQDPLLIESKVRPIAKSAITNVLKLKKLAAKQGYLQLLNKTLALVLPIWN